MIAAGQSSGFLNGATLKVIATAAAQVYCADPVLLVSVVFVLWQFSWHPGRDGK
jgi:hypothetical protein